MAKATTAKLRKFDALARNRFFAHLAATANVSASARRAKISTAHVYALRLKSPAFRDQWAKALAEGHVRNDTNLLADALRPINPNLTDAQSKALAQKQRLQMFLSNAHRSAVRGAPAETASPLTKAETPAAARNRILAKLAQMRDRIDKGPPDGL